MFSQQEVPWGGDLPLVSWGLPQRQQTQILQLVEVVY